MTTKPQSTKSPQETLEPCSCICHQLITRCARCSGTPCRDGWIGDSSEMILREDAVHVAMSHDRTHGSGYRCYEGEAIAEKIAKLPPASTAPVVDEPQIYADGFCARCSELAYPLTRALEKTGVPTGADNWQQTCGPNKVRALADLETCLRRLLFALEEGKPEDIKERIQRANHYIEFHAEVRRRLTALAQERNADSAAATAAPVEQSAIDLDPLEFWCDLVEVLGHPRPVKVNPVSVIAEVEEPLRQIPPTKEHADVADDETDRR